MTASFSGVPGKASVGASGSGRGPVRSCESWMAAYRDGYSSRTPGVLKQRPHSPRGRLTGRPPEHGPEKRMRPPAQTRPGQLDAVQVRTRERGAAEITEGQVRPAEVGHVEIAPPQVAPG